MVEVDRLEAIDFHGGWVEAFGCTFLCIFIFLGRRLGSLIFTEQGNIQKD
jgi:hypothetical protein